MKIEGKTMIPFYNIKLFMIAINKAMNRKIRLLYKETFMIKTFN